MAQRILGLIPARGGSKGVSRKNVRLVGGAPLVCWTWIAAQAVPAIERLVVSTDDPEVASLARAAGIDVPFIRPPYLSSDTVSAFAVVEHALGWLEKAEGYRPDVVLWLQPTSPLRTAQDIQAAIALLERSSAFSVVSVCEAEHHPFWTFSMSADGVLRLLMDQGKSSTRRQELPRAYRVNGAIYLARRDVLLEQQTFDLEPSLGYVMPAERSIDVDSPWDLYLADLVLKDRAASSPADGTQCRK